jgi:hypothetical protein
MAPIRTLLFTTLACLALTACATPADETADARSGSEAGRPVAAKPPHPVTPEPAPPSEENMNCDAKNMAWAKGELADEAMVQRVRTDTGSKAVRVIKPGMAVTMDYREDRVNIDVDDKNHIVNVRCG